MADLVSDLLTLSRYDTNRMTRELTIFDLGEVAKKCQEKLAIEADRYALIQAKNAVTAMEQAVKAIRRGLAKGHDRIAFPTGFCLLLRLLAGLPEGLQRRLLRRMVRS